MAANLRQFTPPGPVSAAFLQDRKNVFRGLAGPIGSGKTNTLIFDALSQAFAMPTCTDGVKRYRHMFLRNSYQDLWKTTIPTWWEWYDKDVGHWSGSEGRRATHTLRFKLPKKEGQKEHEILEFQMWFVALQDQTVEQATKGIEISGGSLNEMNELASDVPTYMLGRILQRRYPPPMKLPESARELDEYGDFKGKHFAGLTGDMNFPDADNWTYETFEELKPEGHHLYKQPGGRDPNAENRQAVPRSAYEELARVNAHRQWWVQSMVDAKWAPIRSGSPVYENYDDQRHCDHGLQPIKGLPIRLMFDQGVRGPAMVVGQLTPEGQFRCLREFVPGTRMGATQFATRCVAFLKLHFDGFRIWCAHCDPAGFSGGDKEWGDLAWAETVAQVMNITIEPAETNEFNARFDAVDQLLQYFPGGQPAFIISRDGCPILRKGFNSHYYYKKKGEGNDAQVDPRPVKNLYSNPHDAVQYGVLGAFGLAAVIQGEPGGRPSVGQAAQDQEDYFDEYDEERYRQAYQPDTDFDVHEV